MPDESATFFYPHFKPLLTRSCERFDDMAGREKSCQARSQVTSIESVDMAYDIGRGGAALKILALAVEGGFCKGRSFLLPSADRWQIEVNLREEKDTLGLGPAQSWNEASVPKQPPLAVAAYSALLLASLIAFYAERGSPCFARR
jgi:hypothetical protein